MRETDFAAIVERRDGGALITCLNESLSLSIHLAVAGRLPAGA
ncbi:MAG: hypothetical protein OXG11_07910 [Chloroflexi bacterium]|nr:hypothetical protein [Chloroflexota bacterium]